jgi:hypothetical protein
MAVEILHSVFKRQSGTHAMTTKIAQALQAIALDELVSEFEYS